MIERGVHCTSCVYFQGEKLWCERYNCEIVSNLALRIECPDFKRKQIRLGGKRKWRE